MNDKKDSTNVELKNNKEEKNNKMPNEKLGFYFSSSLKIHDPNTKEILIHKRAD